MSPVEVVILVAAWAFLLSAPLLRTSRTVALLGALTVAYLAAGFLGIQGSSIVRIALAWIYLVVFWRFQYWLAGLSRIDEHIDSQLRQAMREVTVAHRRWTRSFARGDMPAARTARLATAGACASAVAKLDALQPPTEAWREALRLLRAYVVTFEAEAESEPGAAAGSIGTPGHATLVALNERANAAWHAALHPTAEDARTG